VSGFKEAWKNSGMSIPTKVHLICNHLVEFVKIRGCSNISYYSEQSHESVHVEFLKTWNNYKVKEVNKPRYGKQLLDATMNFNGSHVN
jgi:hypothetical protein